MKLIIFITVCVLIGVQAQFDHTSRTAASLSLTAAGTPTNGISMFSASAADQVVGAACRCNRHQVSNVRTNNGPFNSGTYFEVSLVNTANATLNVVLFTSDGFIYSIVDSLVGTVNFGVGFCDPSPNTCIFDYYCENYFSDATLQLEVCSDSSDNTLQDSINFYTIGVTQYVANVANIPSSRTLTQTTGVVDNYAASNPGPSNFVHYYHNLQTSKAEAGASSRLFIEATNWAGATGSAYICVSFDTLVGNTNSLSSVVFPGGDINGENAIPNSVFVNDPDGCVTYCQQGTVSGAGSVVVASFDSCDFAESGCGFPENIWIGIRSPSATISSTYTVSLRFRSFSVPELVNISSFPSQYDADITDNCNGDLGNFSCEDYYEVISRPTVQAGQPGPYLAVNVLGVYRGSVSAYLSDGNLAGTESLCDDCDVFATCAEVSTTAAEPDCWMVVQPCQWESESEWVVTIEGLAQEVPTEAIEYGLTVNAGTWPVTTVTATEWETGEPFVGSVKPYHYQHYVVRFEEEDLFDDSYFEVQFYTFHEEDEVGFAWRYGNWADDGTCWGYDGRCTTASDCTTSVTEDNTDYCRFSFMPCPYEVNFGFNYDELKVGQLQAGTYYFAVWGIGDSSRYYTSVSYTALFNLRRSTPIFDGVTVSGRVFYLEYTPQFYYVVPNDPTLLEIEFVLSEVNNAAVILYARCGALAGGCPCWTSDYACSSTLECEIAVPVCACPAGELIYLSVFNADADVDDGDNFLAPASFTLTPHLHYYSVPEIQPIQVARAATVIDGTLYGSNVGYHPFPTFDAHYYWISTTNIDPKRDALVLSLTGLVEDPSETVEEGILRLTVAKGGIAHPSTGCFAQVECMVPVNSWISTGQLATCDLVFQPCYQEDICITEDCSIQRSATLPWDYTDMFYVTVSLDSAQSVVLYSLTTQVVEQAPLSLANNEPVYGYVGDLQYVHYVFALPASRSANAILYINLYKDQDQLDSVALYVHHDSSSNPTLAGESSVCYANDFCGACMLPGGSDKSYCVWEYDACELDGLTGNVYVSVRGMAGMQRQGLTKAEYTLTVAVWEPVPLIVANVGLHYPDRIWSNQVLYYSVTVPTLVTGNIVGRVLTIDVGGVRDGTIFFSIEQIEPRNDCGCDLGAELSSVDINQWRRYPCELNTGDVYYVTVNGLQERNCDPVSYLVHARIYDVTEETITLTSVDSVIVGSFDTTSYSIGYNQWKAIRFTTNAVQGTVLNVDITQPLPIGSSIAKNIEARLSIGEVATRSGYNSDIGLSNVGAQPNGQECVTSFVCSGELRTTCSIFVDACAVPEGATTWFLTFTGEDLSVDQVSDPISISIRVVAPRSIVTFPAINDYTSTSTSVAFSSIANSISSSYGKSYVTSSTNSNGIAAGDILTISYSGSASVNFYVQYGRETGVNVECPDICALTGTNPICTFTACEAVPSSTWYIVVDSDTDQSGTISVSRTQSPTTTLAVSPINSFNTVVNFDALGPNQWRYHSINVPASTTSHYEVVISGGASFNNVVYTGVTSNSAVYWPSLTLNALSTTGASTIFSDGDIGLFCGGSSIAGIEATCCYPTDTSVFAVAAGSGGLSAYSIEVQFIEFADGNPVSVNLPSTTARTTTGGRVAWFSFSVPAGNHFWFELDVTSGAAELYLNKGSRAGSDAAFGNFQDDFGSCWFNDDYIQQVCPSAVVAPNFCDGFIAADCYPCQRDNVNSVYFFAVIPTNGGDATYTLTVIGQTNSVSLNTGNNNNLLFPSTGSQNIRIIDDTLASQNFAVYSHFVWNFNQSPFDVAQFVPAVDDPQVSDRFTYPHITFTVSNVVEIGSSVSGDNLVDFFINSNSLAGISDCYGGRDITNGGSILPCLENTNGAASVNPTTGDITCSVLFCDLSCGDQVYLSVSRAVTSVTAVSFSIGVNQNYTAVSNEIDIIPIALTTSGFTNTYSNAQSLNEIVYYRFTISSLDSFLDTQSYTYQLRVSNIVGVTLLDVRPFDPLCSSYANSPIYCDGLNAAGGETCIVDLDPCGFSQITFDPNPQLAFFLRVSRTSGTEATWGFTLSGTVVPISPIDPIETTLVVTEDGASYEAEKDIFNGQWHFYEFNVDSSDFGGYSILQLAVSLFACDSLSSTGGLDVYTSWVEDSTGVIDVARPNRWPTRNCFVSTGDADFIESILGSCNMWGGIYRVAIFANLDLQIYEDPILGVTYPVVYNINFEIENVVPTELALNCKNSILAFRDYYVRPDASNRGSRLIFEITGNSNSGDTLMVSKNANPPGGDNCAWGDSGAIEPYSTINGDYMCTLDSGSCQIIIDICEYSDDTWFIFVVGSGDSYTLSIYNNRVYTPVVDLPSTGFTYSSGGFVSFLDYQFYNFIVDDSRADFFFQFTVGSVSCDNCVLFAYILEGPHGYAAGNGNDGMGKSQACGECGYANCPCFDSSCDTSDLGYCVLYTEGCQVPANQLFIGVRADEDPCAYVIDVTSVAVAESLVEDIEICTSVYCHDYYRLATSTGQFDFTGTMVTVQVINYGDDINVYFNYDHVATPNCNTDSAVCLSGATCSYVLDCNFGSIYVGISNQICIRSLDDCLGTTYSILYTVEDFTIGSATVGSFISSTGVVSVTSTSAFYADQEVLVTGPGGGCGSSCAVSFAAGSYFLIAPGATLSNFQIASLSNTFSTATFGEEGLLFFSIAVPAGVDGFTIELQDFTLPTDGTNYEYLIATGNPSIPCNLCTGVASNILSSACDSDAASIIFSCAEQTTYFLTLASCDDFACAQTFRIRVIFNAPRTLIGSNHNGAYTTLISPASSSCSDQTQWRFYTQAAGPLYVTISEISLPSAATVLLYTPENQCSINSCSALPSIAGEQSSCGVQDGCSTYSCASGLYYIDVSLSVGGVYGAAVEVLVVNSWVDLTGSATDTLIGSEKHFYRVNTANAAQTFKLSVHSGPALRFIVFDGCSNDGTFSETQVCAFGDCYIFVPTFAKHSGASNYYIEVLSDFGSTSNPEWARNNNDRAQTPTSYTISAISGGSNCGAPPATGFCANATIAGVNVWSAISTNSVWSFVNPSLKDREAECLYDELSDRCVYPTDECRYWLKVFSCLETFPQCDSNGFQVAPCLAVCEKVEEVCGSFSDVNLQFPFECCRDRYISDNSTSTCFNIPPPPPPPPTFEEENQSVESSFPPPIEVPVFPTIYATMPPASEFFTFSVAKDAEIERQLVNSASMLSSICVLLVILVAMLI